MTGFVRDEDITLVEAAEESLKIKTKRAKARPAKSRTITKREVKRK